MNTNNHSYIEDNQTVFPLRIQFTSLERAYETFHSFPPDDADFIDGWSRKRDADSQVILLRLSDPSRLKDFLELCAANPDILAVRPITANEFHAAPSHGV